MMVALLLAGWALLLGAQTSAADACPLFPSEHDRFGVNVVRNYGKQIDDYDTDGLNIGWYVDYAIQQTPVRPRGMRYLQTLLPSLHYPIRPEFLGPVIDANPGAIWVLGNEPDRDLQDGMTPDEYVTFYHDMRQFILGRDPTAQIAIAGLVQPTPIRLRYLDMVLAAYEDRYGERLPVDVWTMHNFVLNESLTEAGAGIPVGLEAYADEGESRSIGQHDSVEIFREQLIDFRQWMAANGYRNKPLIISEYGILLPDLYGFTDTVVGNFMVNTFAFLRTATDPETGYPADGNRLVQSWGWYSLNDYVYDVETEIGLNGNLFDHDSGAITPVGRRFAAYTEPLADYHSNAVITAISLSPSSVLSATAASSVTVTARVVNAGNLVAEGVELRLYDGDPDQGGSLLAKSEKVESVAAYCETTYTLAATVTVEGWAPGLHPLTVELGVRDPEAEKSLADNRSQAMLWILEEGQVLERVMAPLVLGDGR